MFCLEDIKIYDMLKTIRAPLLKGLHLESIYIMFVEHAYIDKAGKNETMDLWHACLRHVSYH